MVIKIDKNKNEVFISLNKKFYDTKAVKESLVDFKGVCEGKIKNDKCVINIILKPKEKNMLNIIGHEFCNYTLGLMKNKLLV